MQSLLSLSGVVGAMCCVGMYAEVSFGKVSADKPLFFMVNALGAVLVLIGASHEFDIGDLGTVGQELIWAAISLIGGIRAWKRNNDQVKPARWKTITWRRLRQPPKTNVIAAEVRARAL